MVGDRDIELYFCYREEKGCWGINGVNEKGLNYQNTRLRLLLRLFYFSGIRS